MFFRKLSFQLSLSLALNAFLRAGNDVTMFLHVLAHASIHIPAQSCTASMISHDLPYSSMSCLLFSLYVSVVAEAAAAVVAVVVATSHLEHGLRLRHISYNSGPALVSLLIYPQFFQLN